MSRIRLISPALLAIVVLTTPRASASCSAVRGGVWVRSKRKLTRPTGKMRPAAQILVSPRPTGEGRLRASDEKAVLLVEMLPAGGVGDVGDLRRSIAQRNR